eukprot:1312853-Prymnesium_polylepis.1
MCGKSHVGGGAPVESGGGEQGSRRGGPGQSTRNSRLRPGNAGFERSSEIFADILMRLMTRARTFSTWSSR